MTSVFDFSVSDSFNSYIAHKDIWINNIGFNCWRSVLGSSTVSKSTASTAESMAEDLEEPSFKREKLSSFTGNENPVSYLSNSSLFL